MKISKIQQIKNATGLTVTLGRYKKQTCVYLAFGAFLSMSAEQSKAIGEICGKGAWITCGGNK